MAVRPEKTEAARSRKRTGLRGTSVKSAIQAPAPVGVNVEAYQFGLACGKKKSAPENGGDRSPEAASLLFGLGFGHDRRRRSDCGRGHNLLGWGLDRRKVE